MNEPHEPGAWLHRDADCVVGFFGRGPRLPLDRAAHRLLDSRSVTAWLEQVHGARARTARPGWSGRGDALIAAADLAPLVYTADCVPVLLAAPARLAAVHAGWRGIVADVVGATLARIEDGNRSSTTAWIGPAAAGCCYEVGDDVARQIADASADDVVRETVGRPRIDLAAAVAHQLRSRGVDDVRTVDTCTCCDGAWWSYRRNGPRAGRNLALISRTPRDYTR